MNSDYVQANMHIHAYVIYCTYRYAQTYSETDIPAYIRNLHYEGLTSMFFVFLNF